MDAPYDGRSGNSDRLIEWLTFVAFCVIRRNDYDQQGRHERLLHLPRVDGDLWTPARLHLHAMGLQSVDRRCPGHTKSHATADSVGCRFNGRVYFAVVDWRLRTVNWLSERSLTMSHPQQLRWFWLCSFGGQSPVLILTKNKQYRKIFAAS